jgi:DNA modification methylase
MTNDFNIHCGDAVAVLQTLPSESVNCCITSPPYFGLRDYGVDGQIGLEETPEQYIDRLVSVFREVRRVLRVDGTLWVNIGDSYARGGAGHPDNMSAKGSSYNRPFKTVDGLKSKDLIGIPWMLAFALRADGWYLRSEIIWQKPNPMPESIKDRPTKAHEQIFLLSKSPKYYYDADAVREPFADKRMGNPGAFKWSYANDAVTGKGVRGAGGSSTKLQSEGWNADGKITGRNRRTVWTISTKPFKGAHFAVFPPELPKTCMLAGCPEGGVVLDPFSGAATTGIVAVQNDRKYIGIELNPDYVDLSNQRYADTVVKTTETQMPPMTQNTATLESLFVD